MLYDMIIRSKLFYGLETAQVNDSVFISRIDPFYKKELRYILKMQPNMERGHIKYSRDDELYYKANFMRGIVDRTTYQEKLITPED